MYKICINSILNLYEWIRILPFKNTLMLCLKYVIENCKEIEILDNLDVLIELSLFFKHFL